MNKGGDGGYSRRQEEDEQRKAEARAKINEIFGVSAGARPVAYDGEGQPIDTGADPAIANREGLAKLYSKVRTDAFTGMRRQLDEQKTDRSRNLKFELFARGLRGGSADIDQNANLNRAYVDGVAQLGARADGIATDLRTSDEKTRLGLLSGIDSGMDQGSALSSAVQQMRDNSDRAYAQAQGSAIGDMLGSAGQAYAADKRATGQQRARQWWETNRPAGRSSQPMITRG